MAAWNSSLTWTFISSTQCAHATPATITRINPDRVWIIDWAWPTRGAAFIDAACFLIRAMAAGHSACQAETLAAQCPGWQQASPAAIDVFAVASVRLHDEIARDDPQPFKQRLAAVTCDWADYRLGAGIAVAVM